MKKEIDYMEPISIANNSKKAFCEECREYKPYIVKVIKRSKENDHKKVNFNEKLSYCSYCGCEIFVSELRDENLSEMNSAFIALKEKERD
ncbi:MAG: hypothetical protein JXR88_01995 [Clostridia bacterium]|nr:hypothetical protein [Clostridia bacterium]